LRQPKFVRALSSSPQFVFHHFFNEL